MQQVEEKRVDISVYIAKYLIPVLERKWIFLFSLLFCFALSVILAYMIKPEYVSEAILQTSEPFSATTKQSNQEAYVWTRLATRYIIAEAKKLESPAFCSKVIKRLPPNAREDLKTPLTLASQLQSTFGKLIGSGSRRKGAQGQTISMGEEDQLVMELVKRLGVSTDPDVGLILLRIKSIDKTVAPILLNHCIDLCLAANEEENKLSVKAETQFVQSEKDRADLNLDEAERKLIEFKRKYGIPAEVEVTRDVPLQLELRRLEFNLDMAKRRYHYVEQLTTETQMREAGVIGNIKVINSPSRPMAPSRSEGLRIIGLGVAIGFALGLGIVFFLEYLEGPLRHETDIENLTRVPIIGVVPKI
jgi:uncharacterized protein involved in exopolysaccharide biosynthesis